MQESITKTSITDIQSAATATVTTTANPASEEWLDRGNNIDSH
jgi:hypothetical protein